MSHLDSSFLRQVTRTKGNLFSTECRVQRTIFRSQENLSRQGEASLSHLCPVRRYSKGALAANLRDATRYI